MQYMPLHQNLSVRITIFRNVDNPRVGIFWLARGKEKDWKLFELIKKDSGFPKSFKIYEKNREIGGEFFTAAELSTTLNFNDIYDPSTYSKQMEFLKTNLILIYNYISQKISEFEKNLNPKAS